MRRSVGSDGEDMMMKTTLRKFELPAMILGDRRRDLRVDHSSVPRKLRSAAVRKSGGTESVSPPPLLNHKRSLNYSVNALRTAKRECPRRSRLNMQNGISYCSTRSWAISEAELITKDEEEVAETLHALAQLIPAGIEKKLDGESWPERPLVDLPNELKDSDPAVSNAGSDSEVTPLPTSSDFANNIHPPPPIEENDSPLTPPAFLGRPKSKLSEVRQFSSLNENSSSLPLQRPRVVNVTEQGQRDASMKRENGGALWPTQALFSSGLHASDAVCGHAIISSHAADFPPWLRTAASSTKPGSCEYLNSIKKVLPRLNNKEESWKRCTTHIYISRLVQELQVSKPGCIQHFEGGSQSRPCGDLPPGVGLLMKTSHVDDTASATTEGPFNAIQLPCPIVSCADQKNHNEAGHSDLQQDKKQAPAAAPEPPSALKNQGIDFLALSTRNGDPAAANADTTHVDRDGLDPLAQVHAPYLHSRNSVLPFTLLHNHHPIPTNPYMDHNSATAAPPLTQAHQFPAYLGSQIRHFHTGSGISVEQLQPEQSQQQIWGAQVASPCRSGMLARSDIVPWQNTRHGPHSSMQQYMQTFFPPPQSSVGAVGPKHLVMSQQEQPQLTPALALALPVIRKKSAHSQLNSTCDETSNTVVLVSEAGIG
ncbi:hypothetical protein Dimus_004583 [Dionaea muscipula]